MSFHATMKADCRVLEEIVDPLHVLTICGTTPNIPITNEMVRHCIAGGNLLKQCHMVVRKWSSLEHAARIAWLVTHKTHDPIDLDFGIPSLGCYNDNPLLDGHHRLAAAIFRGEKWIYARCAGEANVIEKYRMPDPIRIG